MGRQAKEQPHHGLGWWEWFTGLLHVVVDVFLQRVRACHLSQRMDLPTVSDLSCIVTGATSGIGLHTAEQLAKAGAHVVLACRNTEAASELVHQWQIDQAQKGGPLLDVEVMKLNLMSLASVRTFSEDWEAQQRSLHVLINNAGIFSMGGYQRFSEDVYEEHMQVNHLAPALLTMLLMPALLRSAPSRVVNVNSAMHHMASIDPEDLSLTSGKRKYNSTLAYSGSKLAQLLFSNILQKKLPAEANVDIIAVHPGEVITNIARRTPKVVQFLYRWSSFFLFSPLEGARSVLFCATDSRVQEYAQGVRSSAYPSVPYFTSSCNPVKVSNQAMDMDMALKIWNETLKLVNLPPDYLDQIFEGSNPSEQHEES
ncbi:hypothetical protein O6H91_02G066000 [Diphasiastrum complanatum]|uniref:Uncharacterized protein n=4 Tax=Diphasiastrum complanatum TaxID=34168 RepID=A0ACC2EGE9_DIPCM|nr:hypothetical protein O6H91_02G066000 [Diphasiastrum complanatum]KAJ7565595.1 hypothetical protein O6H91_02G066000 [Diphasiastrum complanatum]KAJ7565596.1 hypothetical protein O6H91_02G066000 [Diphasiastrum complanatum]KAJ7565597.1 hypothetical protein O6H91_02G066000 [Diphasiastrum complanatum]